MPTLFKDGHSVTTSIPAEAVQLRAKGYAEVKTQESAPVVEATIELAEELVEETPKKPRTRKADTEVVTPSE